MRYALHQMGLLPGSRPDSLRRNADPHEHRHMKGDGSWWVNDAQGIPLVRVCEECEEAQLSRFRPEIVMGYTQEDVDEPIDPEPNPSDRERTEYRGFGIEAADTTQLGYTTGEGGKLRFGKGRKEHVYFIYEPEDSEHPIKTVSTLKAARAYIDEYLGSDPEPNPIDMSMQDKWDNANYAVRVAERANDYKALESAKAEVRRVYQEMQDIRARNRAAMGRNPKRTSRRLDPNACPSCGGVSHPASGSVLPSGEVVCGPCVRRFWGWASEHGEKRYRVGPKGKGAEYIPFPTGITKPKPTKNGRRTSKKRTSRSRP